MFDLRYDYVTLADIDECDQPNTTCSEGAKCENLVAGYRCYCPKGTHGEAYNGMCMKNQELSLMARMAIGKSVCFDSWMIFCFMSAYLSIHSFKNPSSRHRY